MCNGNARIPSEKKMEPRKQWIVTIRRDEGPLLEVNKS